jgi:hypothetical protein
MEPIRIFYEETKPDEYNDPVFCAVKKHHTDEQIKTGTGSRKNRAEIHSSEQIQLFPDTDYGENENLFRDLEKRYNTDRAVFYKMDFHAPEMLPAAEEFQNTLEELCKAAKKLFDESGGMSGQIAALNIMSRICKDCYVMEEEVSKHAKMMMESYPDDELLCEDMKDIAESFLDFSLKVYHTMMKYKHKSISEKKTETV